MTALFSKLDGFDIDIFEKRSQFKSCENIHGAFGASVSAQKRSINLALSHRGMVALDACGILHDVMKEIIRMPRRVIHGRDGKIVYQPYGRPDEAIWSIGRQYLNEKLLTLVENLPNVNIRFNHVLLDATKDGRCTFVDNRNNTEIIYQFDIIIGADGAYSATRESILRTSRTNFSRKYVEHGYKELTIPPKVATETGGDVSYALPDHEGLHIWPRGRFMLIALPNPDKSFTATLFAPFHGEDGFDSLDSSNAEAVENYFRRHFPDVMPVIESTLCHDFRENPVGSLVTMRVRPWNLGKIVLIGDAAHAVVPFFGQGMNAAFEDAFILYNLFKNSLDGQPINIENILDEFSKRRQPATDALADLCIEHYDDMAKNTNSAIYLLRSRFNALLRAVFPRYFIPLYSMVAFTSIPYDEAVQRADAQDTYLNALFLTGATVLLGVGSLSLSKRLFEWTRR